METRKQYWLGFNFDVLEFRIIVEEKSSWSLGLRSEAVVKVRIKNEIIISAAEGNGPINALDKALKKALEHYFSVSSLFIADYKVKKVRSLDTKKKGSASSVKIVIVISNGKEIVGKNRSKKTWKAEAVSENIIEASLFALVKALDQAISERPLSPQKTASLSLFKFFAHK